MEYDTLLDMYTQLAAFADQGDEQGAQDLLAQRFKELPEDVQGELAVRMYLSAVENKVQEEDVLHGIQKEGLATLEALEILKKELEKKGEAGG